MEYYKGYLYYWAIIGITIEMKKKKLLITENSMLDSLLHQTTIP